MPYYLYSKPHGAQHRENRDTGEVTRFEKYFLVRDDLKQSIAVTYFWRGEFQHLFRNNAAKTKSKKIEYDIEFPSQACVTAPSALLSTIVFHGDESQKRSNNPCPARDAFSPIMEDRGQTDSRQIQLQKQAKSEPQKNYMRSMGNAILDGKWAECPSALLKFQTGCRKFQIVLVFLHNVVREVRDEKRRHGRKAYYRTAPLNSSARTGWKAKANYACRSV